MAQNTKSQLKKKKPKLKIYGTNYKTKDGSCIRDFIHVSDLAEMHYLSAKYIIKDDLDLGSVIVSAGGNGDVEGGIGQSLDMTPQSPVCNDGGQNMVLGVASVDEQDNHIRWSNYGSCIDVVAPGKKIFSTSVCFSSFDLSRSLIVSWSVIKVLIFCFFRFNWERIFFL